MNLQEVSSFHERVLGVSEVHADVDHRVLRSADTQLVIHAIPPQLAKSIDITIPPLARAAQAIKPFSTVTDLAQAERVAEEFGGRVWGQVWPGPGMRSRHVCDPEGNIIVS